MKICAVLTQPDPQLNTGYYPCTLKVEREGDELFLRVSEIGPEQTFKGQAVDFLVANYPGFMFASSVELDKPLTGEDIARYMLALAD